jgi:predicted ATPase
MMTYLRVFISEWPVHFDSVEKVARREDWSAIRFGLMHRSESSYAFQHDRIQEATYSLIPRKRTPKHGTPWGRACTPGGPQS